MTEFVISINSSLISLSRYTRLRGGQVRNALRDVHPVPDSRKGWKLQGPRTSNAKAKRRKPSPVHRTNA